MWFKSGWWEKPAGDHKITRTEILSLKRYISGSGGGVDFISPARFPL
jgi:hypothetical protein